MEQPDYRRTLTVLLVLCGACILVVIAAFWVRSNAVNDNIDRVGRESAARVAAVQAEADARALSQCESGNVFRAKDLATWEYILGLSPPSPNPADRARAVKFHAYIVEKDKLRDCRALVKGTS